VEGVEVGYVGDVDVDFDVDVDDDGE